MSIPCKATFRLNNEIVYRMTVNVGWVWEEARIPQAIINSLDLYKEFMGKDLEFDEVEAYGRRFVWDDNELKPMTYHWMVH